jgi:hypothetical protein
MLIDEWLQYEVMYKGYVEYFELNDILMDVFGCGFMMLIIWIFGVESNGIKKPVWKNFEYIFLILLAVIISISILTCVIALYPSTACNHTWMVMNQLKNPDTFWQIHPLHGSEYHVLQPVAGLLIILIACLFFTSIDILKTQPSANLHAPYNASTEI